MSSTASISYGVKLPSTAVTSGSICISSPELAPFTDIKFEHVYTRSIKKFDLLVTCESLIRDGLVETGRELKSLPVNKITTFTGPTNSAVIIEHC